MSNPMILLTILLCAAVTYLTRFPPLLFSRHIQVSERIAQGLRYIPIGVFTAMVAPAILLHPLKSGGHVDIPFWSAAVVALIVATWTKNPLWTMLASVIAIALLRLLVG